MKTMQVQDQSGSNDQVDVPDFGTVVNANWGMSGSQSAISPEPPNAAVVPATPPGPTGTAKLPATNGVPSAGGPGSPYYTVDADEGDPFGLNQVLGAGQNSGFAPPIQLTDAHQAFASPPATNAVPPQWSMPIAPVTPSAATARRSAGSGKRRLILKVVAAILVIVAGVGFLSLSLFSAPASSAGTAGTQTSAQGTRPQPTPQKTVKAQSQPTARPATSPTQANQPAGTWLPAQLPAGWAAAGLSEGDELFAMRTAMTFTDREMSIDFRNIGTAQNHGGTLTAAVFLLTAAAQQRFATNDARATGAFFNKVSSEQLIQVVINALPQNVAYKAQNGHRFSVVDVAFNLWQSMLINGQKQQREQLDPQTGQPVLHHMSVLLVRQTPGSQGGNAPMGGTGWVVSNYSLDQGQASVVTPA